MQRKQNNDISAVEWGFNPHPAEKPDATGDRNNRTINVILVSILIRLRSRMQRKQNNDISAVEWGFNPHPAEKPDATKAKQRYIRRRVGFQSSSG